MRAAKLAETGSDDLRIWDWRYYHNRLLRERYSWARLESSLVGMLGRLQTPSLAAE